MLDASSVPGQISFFYLDTFAVWGGIRNVTPPGVRWTTAPADPGSLWRTGARNGFRFDRRVDPVSRNGYHSLLIIVVPHWFLATLTAVLPALRLSACRRARHPAPGHCPNCGYDLRATPDRCPECGTVAVTSKA
jgi:hypothetical protein